MRLIHLADLAAMSASPPPEAATSWPAAFKPFYDPF